MKISELTAKVGAELENRGADIEIRGVAPVEEAQSEQIAYVGNPAERAAVKTTGASALITARSEAWLPSHVLAHRTWRDSNAELDQQFVRDPLLAL